MKDVQQLHECSINIMPIFKMKKDSKLFACFDHTLLIGMELLSQCLPQLPFSRGCPALMIPVALQLWLLYKQKTACQGK